jgi:hypothetical protein
MKTAGVVIAGVAGVVLLLAVDLGAQERFLTLSVGDATDYDLDLIDGPTPIDPAASRYCVRMPEGERTIDRYAGSAWRPGEKPAARTGLESATAVSGQAASGSGSGATSGPTDWIQFEAISASIYYVIAGGDVEGATWEASPPRMFIRRDAANRIHVCVGRAGMQPPAVP